MNRVIHELQQGSPEWHAYRRTRYNASDAPAMLGKSRYVTRTELLAQYAIGTEREISADTQRRFDDGHAYEAAARGIAEGIIGEELFPVTMSIDYDGLPLSASFDGLDMAEEIAFEHKSLNADLEAALAIGEIPEEYQYQMEQQLLISGARRVLFMASRGTAESEQHEWYESRPEIRARLIAGWRQFSEDVKNYQAPEVIPAAVARTMEDLPAVSVKVDGALAVVSNLDLFGQRLTDFVSGLNMEPEDDQGFADAEKAVKVLERAQEALQAAENQALAQVSSVDQLVKTIAALRETARATRLRLEKVVKTQKDVVRGRIVQSGKERLADHHKALFGRLGGTFPMPPVDFAAAVKNKRTIASLREAVDAALVAGKLGANEVADKIQINLNILSALEEKYQHLFADRATLVLKAPDDFGTAVKLRCSEFDALEARRFEAERERIRKEEAARIEREAAAQAEAERAARVAEETRQRAERETEARRAHEVAARDSTTTAPVATPPATVKREQYAAQKDSGAAPRAPGKPRPTDDQMIQILALHFRVHESKIIEWLLDMDLHAASNRMVSEFIQA